MDLTSLKIIKKLIRKYQIFPSKRWGQHFLIDRSVLRKILEASDLQSRDIVLEIGPGIGNLTQELAKRVKKVIAIEKDPKMVEILREVLKEFKNVKIIKEDILKINLQSKILNLKSYKVVANLPYYITSPVIRKFLEEPVRRPQVIILMVQKEVAQRICSTKKMSLLALSIQFYAKVKIVSYVSKKSFWPKPKVDSAIIKIAPRVNKYIADELFKKRFFRIVKAGFSQPRKQLLNTLSKGLKLEKEKIKTWLLKNKIKPRERAETLNLKNWLLLTKSFNNLFSP